MNAEKIKSKILSPLTTSKPYKLGVALSGGGARGFAHLGALKALEEAGLKPDVIAGVSAGSLAGCLYAAGLPIKDIMRLFSVAKFSDFCSFEPRSGEGAFSLKKLGVFLEKVTGIKNLEDLPLPLFIGVTDIDRAKPAEFHTGRIGERVMASCSIPIMFKPVVIDGIHYVDGGVLRNLPAWIIRDKCQKLIGINCSPIIPYNYKKTFLGIAMRSYNLMTKANQLTDMNMCDRMIVTPELVDYQAFNLKEINKVFQSGYRAAKEALAASPLL